MSGGIATLSDFSPFETAIGSVVRQCLRPLLEQLLVQRGVEHAVVLLKDRVLAFGSCSELSSISSRSPAHFYTHPGPAHAASQTPSTPSTTILTASTAAATATSEGIGATAHALWSLWPTLQAPIRALMSSRLDTAQEIALHGRKNRTIIRRVASSAALVLHVRTNTHAARMQSVTNKAAHLLERFLMTITAIEESVR